MNPTITHIRHLLATKGLTVQSVAKHHEVPEQKVRDAMRRPDVEGEKAISKALETSAHLLWPERFDADGQRLKPQPRRLYPASDSTQRLSDRVA